MVVVYILFSARFNKIYIGQTGSLVSRFHSHNFLSNKGWTINFRPWEVVYTEFFETRSKALKREKELKSGKGREWVRESLKQHYFTRGFISATLCLYLKSCPFFL
ncbi:MAG: GIY-YIG nuclease family protein [Cytophagales bacterium]|nr:GIY-YIG nuclease family protein [Cytophagales bacterium]